MLFMENGNGDRGIPPLPSPIGYGMYL